MTREDCADLFGIVDHETIIALARTIKMALDVGVKPRALAHLAGWCSAPPQPGDLVVEMSSWTPNVNRVGLLESYSSATGDFVILIQLEPRRTCRWSNATYIRLPKNDAQRKEALGL